METRLYHLYTLTALHVGIGQGSGVIDLPIAREKSTGLPVVPGSAVKGVLREELRPDALPLETWLALFGPETTAGQDLHAGALAVGDARLLCLPVRSLRGTFAYATCPLVLRRYARDLGTDHPPIPPWRRIRRRMPTIPSWRTRPRLPGRFGDTGGRRAGSRHLGRCHRAPDFPRRCRLANPVPPALFDPDRRGLRFPGRNRHRGTRTRPAEGRHPDRGQGRAVV